MRVVSVDGAHHAIEPPPQPHQDDARLRRDVEVFAVSGLPIPAMAKAILLDHGNTPGRQVWRQPSLGLELCLSTPEADPRQQLHCHLRGDRASQSPPDRLDGRRRRGRSRTRSPADALSPRQGTVRVKPARILAEPVRM